MPHISFFGKKLLLKTALTLVLLPLLLLSHQVFAQTASQSTPSQVTTEQTFLIEGIIENTDKQPIAGASLRIVGTNQGTYSDARGRFRLTSPTKQATVRASSLGYEAREIVLSADSSQTLVLTPLPIQMQSVEVTSGISAEEIIRKAIENKARNLRNVQSLARRVYTKLNFSTTFKVILGKPETEKFMTETVAQVYESFAPKRTSHSVILQRRQTPNFPAQANIAAVTQLLNLLEDEIVVGTTRLRSPLASSALGFYEYALLERKAYSGKAYSGRGGQLAGSTVFIIQFKPKSRTFPGLEGALSIIEDSFAPVSADFTTSQGTALPALSNLRYAQTYEPFGDSTRAVWLPTYSRLTGKLSASLAIADVSGDINLQTIVSNVEVLQTLPSAALKPAKTTSLAKVQRKNSPVRSAKLSDNDFITLAPTVDSVDTQFWKTAALLEYTPAEDSLYRATDSIAQISIKAGKRTSTEIFDSTLVATETSLRIQQSSVPYFTQNALFRFQLGKATTLGLSPILMQPRTTGRIYGIEAGLDWEQSSVRAEIMTSERWAWFGGLRLVQRLFVGDSGNDAAGEADTDESSMKSGLAIIGDVYSRVRSFQPRPLEGLGWIGTATDFGVFEHHYDFFLEQGFSLGLKGALGRLEAALTGQLLRTSAMNTLPGTPATIRQNLTSANGDFRLLRGELSWNQAAVPLQGIPAAGEKTVFAARISGTLGEDILQNRPYSKLEGSAMLIQPTFFTGYSPMYLMLSARGGMVSEFAPPQERFIFFRRYAVFGNGGDFLTPDLSSIGGTQMLSLRAEHNFSDLVWRACGLPTHKGRGLELILHGGTALFTQNTPWLQNEGTPPRASDGWYSEVGFGIGRIPLFVIDFATLRFDAAWGIGGASTGKFGWSVSAAFSF